MRHVVGVVVVALAVNGVASSGSAQTFSVVNSCSYTVYPGIYPPVYQNGGWTMRMRCETRSGCRSAYSSARTVPQECPRIAVLASR